MHEALQRMQALLSRMVSGRARTHTATLASARRGCGTAGREGALLAAWARTARAFGPNCGPRCNPIHQVHAP